MYGWAFSLCLWAIFLLMLARAYWPAKGKHFADESDKEWGTDNDGHRL